MRSVSGAAGVFDMTRLEIHIMPRPAKRASTATVVAKTRFSPSKDKNGLDSRIPACSHSNRAARGSRHRLTVMITPTAQGSRNPANRSGLKSDAKRNRSSKYNPRPLTYPRTNRCGLLTRLSITAA